MLRKISAYDFNSKIKSKNFNIEEYKKIIEEIFEDK